MRVIILAAGNSVQMNGTIKCLIKNPLTNKTILQHLLDAFSDCEPLVVVGYRAVEIMQDYPHLEYILNSHWSLTAPSYSVGLALADEPCYIVPGDILLDRALVEYLHQAPENCVLTRKQENRGEQSTNYVVRNDIVEEAYVGALRNSEDPEGTGIIKLTEPQLLQELKMNCLKHGNLHIGLNLAYLNNAVPIYNLDLADHEINEFNAYLDYINYLKACKGKKL